MSSILHGQLESLLPLLHLGRGDVDEEPLELGRQPREVLDHDEPQPLAVLLVVLVTLELSEHPANMKPLYTCVLYLRSSQLG